MEIKQITYYLEDVASVGPILFHDDMKRLQ